MDELPPESEAYRRFALACYDPDGAILTVQEWSELFHQRFTDPDRSWWMKRTGLTAPAGTGGWADVHVSTVWIGLDHNFRQPGSPPLPWEAMIFGGDHDGEQWHYPSREAAYTHHEWLVTALRQGIDPRSEMRDDAFRLGAEFDA